MTFRVENICFNDVDLCDIILFLNKSHSSFCIRICIYMYICVCGCVLIYLGLDICSYHECIIVCLKDHGVDLKEMRFYNSHNEREKGCFRKVSKAM